MSRNFWEPHEADVKFDLYKTPNMPFYDCLSGKYLYGDAKVLHDIQEALGKIDVSVDNIEVEHNSMEVYPEVSIKGHMDPDIRRKHTGFTVSDFIKRTMATMPYAVTKVIFNPPATVVLWADGSKTVVKCGEHDEFDPEKGLVMAIIKKLLGNKGNYYNVIKNLMKEAEYQYNNYAEGEFTSDTPMVVVKKMRTITSRPAMQNVAKLDVAYFECPVCGDEILKSGARYCANCGQRLIWEEK